MTILARQEPPAKFELWHYNPSLIAAVIFAGIFVVLTAYHAFLIVRRRTWFCIPFIIGGLFEVIGYVTRGMNHNNTDEVMLYTIQSIMLLLAPILFAASVYMILGRIIRATGGEAYSSIRVNWLTKIFVGGDIFCFFIQGGGGGMLAKASSQDDVDMGNNIILGGLILQILVFLVFLYIAIRFQSKMARHPTSAALDGPLGQRNGSSGPYGQMTWGKLMAGLYLTSILITIRNLFRVIEFGMGQDSYLLANEWPLYVFDGILMVLVLVTCILWYNPAISKNKKFGLLDSEARDDMSPIASRQKIPNTQYRSAPVRPWS